MKTIKILGSGCAKCITTYNNVVEALNETGFKADVQKIEDIEEIMKYNILSTPALLIDEEIKIKGRVADKREIINLLRQN